MYTEGHTVAKLRRLPGNLLDAVRLFEQSKVMRDSLGAAFVDSYSKLKHREWKSYASHISQWERDHTLDA
jgi:glutamine synthetase